MQHPKGAATPPSHFSDRLSVRSPLLDQLPDGPLATVLDTNTVMALWLFQDPRLPGLRAAADEGHLRLLSRGDALEELRRVLAYVQFAVSPERQAEILASYSARVALTPPVPEDAMPLPLCRDPDDQKFLEIARDGGARLLVTRDKALLKLARRKEIAPRFAILTPEMLEALLTVSA